MPQVLLLSIRFHDGRYHGRPDWPPSPARLFQALVAGTARGKSLANQDKAALAWLETLAPPLIAAPTVRVGQGFINYVPNNDLDAVGGDPRRVGEINAGKVIRPRIFDASVPLIYVWTFDGSEDNGRHARTVREIAERLYQLGRGIDMAWAIGEILTPEELDARLVSHPGPVHRPSAGGSGTALLCPRKGSLESLIRRYEAAGKRFKLLYVHAPTKKDPERMKSAGQLFSQAPKPRFASIAYDSPPRQFLFDIRAATSEPSFMPWPSARVAELVTYLRDKATGRLKNALPEEEAKIERVLVGRNATEADKAARVRIVPLPSIGHGQADQAIRRVLVDIPPNCPLRADDIAWAFSGLEEIDRTTGEIVWNLVPAKERGMLGHYGIGVGEQDGFRLWRTVTPIAVPVMRPRGGTGGAKRVAREAGIARAVAQALRHAGILTKVAAIRVRREPFERKGGRAECFAVPERFVARGLHHVEIAFAEAVRGPLVIGDGRYLGLGLLAPVKDSWRAAMVFTLPPETHVAIADAAALLRAVRRALMARSRNGGNTVPRLFSGHEPDGAPARSGGHEHVFLAADDAEGGGRVDRLIVAAPWACDRSGHAPRRSDCDLFDHVVSSLSEVRAGKLGVVTLAQPLALTTGDPLFGPARTWKSRTLYRPTRHASRGKDQAVAVVRDVIAECERRGLPRPEVELKELNAGPNGGGLAVRVRLRFAVAVEGPIMLGRDSHMGGGLFAAVD